VGGAVEELFVEFGGADRVVVVDALDLGGVGGSGESGVAVGAEGLEAGLVSAGGVHGGGLHHHDAQGEQAEHGQGEDVPAAEAVDGVFHIGVIGRLARPA
jgi:hypothetical protein